jgi:hypothetical protein
MNNISDDVFKEKYFKYKNKYIKLKNNMNEENEYILEGGYNPFKDSESAKFIKTIIPLSDFKITKDVTYFNLLRNAEATSPINTSLDAIQDRMPTISYKSYSTSIYNTITFSVNYNNKVQTYEITIDKPSSVKPYLLPIIHDKTKIFDFDLHDENWPTATGEVIGRFYKELIPHFIIKYSTDLNFKLSDDDLKKFLDSVSASHINKDYTITNSSNKLTFKLNDAPDKKLVFKIEFLSEPPAPANSIRVSFNQIVMKYPTDNISDNIFYKINNIIPDSTEVTSFLTPILQIVTVFVTVFKYMKALNEHINTKYIQSSDHLTLENITKDLVVKGNAINNIITMANTTAPAS